MSDNNQILRLLATIREECAGIRSRQEELYEILVSYKDQIQDLRATVVDKLAGLPRSPYIAGQLVPAPHKTDGVDDYRQVLATYLHKVTENTPADEKPADLVWERPAPVKPEDIVLEDDEDDRPRRRHGGGGGGHRRDNDLERGPDRDIEPIDLDDDEDEDEAEGGEEEAGAGGAGGSGERRRRKRRRRGGRGRKREGGGQAAGSAAPEGEGAAGDAPV